MVIKWNFKTFLVFVFEKIGLTSSASERHKNDRIFCRCLLTSLVISLSLTAHAGDPYQTARELVISQACSNGETVDEFLDHKIRPSRRDLGWRVFEADNGYIVERAFLISKSMEIRYRWHVDTQGSIYAENSRSENLCS